MGTLRSLAVTADRARGFLKHRDTENTERNNEGGKNEGGKNEGGKNDGGKNDGGKEEWGEPLSLWVGVVVRTDGRNSRWGRRCGATKSLRQYDR